MPEDEYGRSHMFGFPLARRGLSTGLGSTGGERVRSRSTETHQDEGTRTNPVCRKTRPNDVHGRRDRPPRGDGRTTETETLCEK